MASAATAAAAPAKKAPSAAPSSKAAAKVTTFTVDLSAPAGSKVIDPAGFEAYLRDSIKVAGKKANLGESVGVSRKGATVSVAAKIPFSKRYVKYLTKRYLKKESTREYLRVVADGKLGYTVKFLVLGGDKEEES